MVRRPRPAVRIDYGRRPPDLELGDVQEALQYAAEAVRERELPLAG